MIPEPYPRPPRGISRQARAVIATVYVLIALGFGGFGAHLLSQGSARKGAIALVGATYCVLRAGWEIWRMRAC